MPVAYEFCDGHYFEIYLMIQYFEYHPVGTCCKLMQFSMENDRVVDVHFVGGCHGNLQGIAALVKGMTREEVISKLSGIRCGNKSTSCPDQFSKALQQVDDVTANGDNRRE